MALIEKKYNKECNLLDIKTQNALMKQENLRIKQEAILEKLTYYKEKRARLQNLNDYSAD